MPVFGMDKMISLADIAMYTDEEEVPLRQVLANVKAKENAQTANLNYGKASKEELAEYMAQVLPNFDRDRVYSSDIKKLIQWYNLLIENGVADFEEAEEAAAE
jgi:hypothetical protein